MTWAYIMMVALTDRQLTDDAGDKDEEQIGSWHPTPRKKKRNKKFPPQREKHTTLRTLCVYVRARRRRRLLSRYTRLPCIHRSPVAVQLYNKSLLLISSIVDGLLQKSCSDGRRPGPAASFGSTIVSCDGRRKKKQANLLNFSRSDFVLLFSRIFFLPPTK